MAHAGGAFPHHLHRFTSSSAGIAALIGLLILLGWRYDIAVLTSIRPGMEAAKFGSALGCILTGAALFFATRDSNHLEYRIARIVLAAIPVALAGFVLVAAACTGFFPDCRVLRQMLRIPEARDFMALGSAASLFLVGFSLLILDYETRHGRRPAQFLCLVALFPALLGILDNLLTPWVSYTGMALASSVALALLALGTIAARAEAGFMSRFWTATLGGSLRRKLLPAAVIVPLLLGWLRWKGQEAGFYAAEVGTALFTLATLSILAALIWWTTGSLDELDRERRTAEEELRKSHESLERMVVDRTRELRATEEDYRVLFESANEAILIFDPDDEIIHAANPAACDMYGVDRADLVGSGLRAYTCDVERGKKQLCELVRTGSVRNFETVHRRKDGTPIYLLANSSFVGYRGQKLVLTVLRDVSDRRRAEEERRLLSAAIEQAAESVLITDPEGKIVYVNSAFEQVSGYRREEVLGQNPRILKSGKHDPEFYHQMWSRLTAGQAWSGLLTNKRKDGILYQEEASIFPVRDADGRILNYVAVKRDITHEKQLELQLYQSQKMEAVGRLAGGVAHDFNNLLMIINSYAELMLQKLPPDDPLRRYPEQVVAAARRAAALTSQLLAFSRKQVLELANVDVNALLRDLARMLPRLIGEDIRLTIAPGRDVKMIRADRGQLEQVLMNLATNARDAMPEGGILRIETSNVALGDSYCKTHALSTPGDYVLVTVSDTGSGIDRDTLPHIFEPFFTTKERGKGTGLGLSTVYGIVKQFGGSIWAYSEPGHGSTFKMYFPVEERSAFEARPEAEAHAALPTGSETILLVEDEDALRQSTRESLESLGYGVVEAKNGDEALAMAARFGETINLLVTDVVMPGMNGKALADQLCAARPQLRVLFMSGYTNGTLQQRGIVGPEVSFLQKPFGIAALAREVRRLLAPADERQKPSIPEESKA